MIRLLLIDTSNEDLPDIGKQGIDEDITLEVVFPPTFTIQRYLEADTNVKSATKIYERDYSEFKDPWSNRACLYKLLENFIRKGRKHLSSKFQ